MTETLELSNADFTFTFDVHVTKEGFFTHESSIIETTQFLDYDQGDDAKVVNIVDTGPKCTFKPGDKVLLEPLMWTSSFDVNGNRLWKSDESKIIGVVEDDG